MFAGYKTIAPHQIQLEQFDHQNPELITCSFVMSVKFYQTVY